MKFSGKTINTVAMACFITMINLHGTSLAPATAKFLKDEIVSYIISGSVQLVGATVKDGNGNGIGNGNGNWK